MPAGSTFGGDSDFSTSPMSFGEDTISRSLRRCFPDGMKRKKLMINVQIRRPTTVAPVALAMTTNRHRGCRQALGSRYPYTECKRYQHVNDCMLISINLPKQVHGRLQFTRACIAYDNYERLSEATGALGHSENFLERVVGTSPLIPVIVRSINVQMLYEYVNIAAPSIDIFFSVYTYYLRTRLADLYCGTRTRVWPACDVHQFNRYICMHARAVNMVGTQVLIPQIESCGQLPLRVHITFVEGKTFGPYLRRRARFCGGCFMHGYAPWTGWHM